MNKRPEKNDDQSSVDIPLCDRIAAEIIARTKTAARAELAAFEAATADIEKLRGISQQFASQLEEKKACLVAERSALAPGVDIVESLQRRRNLEREIAEVELSMKEFDIEFWPVAVKDANDIKNKINDRLGPIVWEMKQDYQARLDSLFLELIAIMQAFHDAVDNIGQKPEFFEIRGSLSSITSFDLNTLLFNKMNALRLTFGIIPEKITNKRYQAVVSFQEQKIDD